MPSVNTGKRVIKAIKVYQDHVTLSFNKGKRLKISKEAYLSTYLYEGKSVSNKEIDKLNELTALSTLLNYAMSLLSKRHYSEKKMYEKLYKKEANKSSCMSVISKLKENDLLDDKAYMEDLITWDHERYFGKNKIIKHLKEQGIADNLIARASFSASNELKKAKGLIPKLDKKYSRYALEIKKQHVYQALLGQGYDYEIAKEAVSLVKGDKPKVEKEKLINDFKKIKKRYESKYEGYQLKQKIYAALLNKGYKSKDIKIVLEEYANENDF
ncbi:MAG: RecX family transcriptional regulator [Bacilli bacterium]|nr:RecX family transcriptional regulator [Bacilli bacterium]